MQKSLFAEMLILNMIVLLILLLIGTSYLPAHSSGISPVVLVYRTMQAYFEKPSKSTTTIGHLLKSKVDKPQVHPAGVFVTLSTNGKPRACWGSVYPSHNNLTESIVYTTIGALTKDYRYKPISAHEWKNLKPQVTIIERIEPIESIQSQNPLRDGLMLRAGNKSGVILPGEASDATYQLVRCKLKAGLSAHENYQLYRFKADIYE